MYQCTEAVLKEEGPASAEPGQTGGIVQAFTSRKEK